MLDPARSHVQGDSSADLDYYDESSLALPENSSITGANGVAANIELPTVGNSAVYRLGTGASLSANKDIVIDTMPPFVEQVRVAVEEEGGMRWYRGVLGTHRLTRKCPCSEKGVSIFVGCSIAVFQSSWSCGRCRLPTRLGYMAQGR